MTFVIKQERRKIIIQRYTNEKTFQNRIIFRFQQLFKGGKNKSFLDHILIHMSFPMFLKIEKLFLLKFKRNHSYFSIDEFSKDFFML